MTALPYQDLLQLVRQLPQHVQLRLAEDLLQTLRTSAPKKTGNTIRHYTDLNINKEVQLKGCIVPGTELKSKIM